jgi:hypothetical protein
MDLIAKLNLTVVGASKRTTAAGLVNRAFAPVLPEEQSAIPRLQRSSEAAQTTFAEELPAFVDANDLRAEAERASSAIGLPH